MSFQSDAAKATERMQWFIKCQKALGHNFQYLEQLDEYSPYDGLLLKEAFTGIVEVKVRPTWTFQSICDLGGQMLELKKLKGIEAKVKGTILEGKSIMYFIFFKDCLAVWKLNNSDEYKWLNSMYPANSQGGHDVVKATVNLPRADGIYQYEPTLKADAKF